MCQVETCDRRAEKRGFCPAHHKRVLKHGHRIENLELWSTSHPNGRRVVDLIEFSLAMLDRYGEEFQLIVHE